MDAFRDLSVVHILRSILLGTPKDSWWATVLIWLVRLISFSLILRTYIGPFLLARMSDRIRVRSISLRSIRGLYVRTGSRTWRVDRIGISYSYHPALEGFSGLSVRVKIQGLKLEIGGNDSLTPTPRFPRRRKLTLADLSPSPLARRLWTVASSLVSWLDPLVRPLVRSVVIACLRLFIRYLPAISQAIDFDLYSAVVTFTALPVTSFTIQEAKLHTSLAFTQLEHPNHTEDKDTNLSREKWTSSRRMATWKSRLSGSFRRAWERAWEMTQGTASVSLKLCNVVGSTSRAQSSDEFFNLPGAIDLAASAQFNPKRGKIDAHSLKTTLNIGELVVAVDIVHSIMEMLKIHRESHPSNAFHDSSPPDSALLSPGALSIGSPTSLYTPSLLSALITPNTANSNYPASPHSPFLEVLSASIPRRHKRYPVPRLKDTRDQSWLSLLALIDVRISTISLTFHPSDRHGESETYVALVHDVVFGAELSGPQNQLHCAWLGRGVEGGDLTPDAYAFGFSLDKVALERIRSDSRQGPLRLLMLRSLEFQALISQWPSPWLVASPFIAGDPNAALLAVQLTLDELVMLEDLNSLHDLLSRAKRKEKKDTDVTHHQYFLPLPRLSLDVHCGTISGRVINSNPDQENHSFIVELRTEGFAVSVDAQFLPSFSTPHHQFAPHELPLQLNFTVAAIWKPTFVRVLYNPLISGEHQSFQYTSLTECEFMDDHALLSLEAIEVKGDGRAFGHFGDESKSVASIDTSTLFVDVRCSADALSIELWQKGVIDSIVKLFSIPPRRTWPELTTPPASPPLLDRLPFGCSATFSLARIVLFVTSPDLNPNDDSDISRGLAFRTGVSLQYCALRSTHVHHFKNLSQHSQIRHKLYLPEDRIVEALSAARASTITYRSEAFLRLSVRNSALRSALATQYATDDPNIAERDHPALSTKDFLQLPSGKAEICISGKRNPAFPSSRDVFKLSVQIPVVRGTFELGHVYSLLLASRTLSSFSRRRALSPSTPSESDLSFQFHGSTKTMQILWVLPRQKIYTRIDSVTICSLPGDRIGIKWNKFLLCVATPPPVKSIHITGDRWEEFVRLHQWDVQIPRLPTPSFSISVSGDNARLRIPFGYILADLIHDLGVTIKCVRHLAHTVTIGGNIRMSPPEAELAKTIPTFAIRIRCVSLEAADDSFETKLNIIWRAGLEASKQRNEREEAFMLKVAAIQQVESSRGAQSSPNNQIGSDYRFNSSHTVSVEDAYQRLRHIHDVDWNLRHRLLKQERSLSEEAILRRLRGEHTMRVSTEIPDLVFVAPVDPVPPLFRAMLYDLSLNVSPPSFPLNRLPDFMREYGHGLPAGTQFSLLLPMHLHFTLSSLRVTLRDYPLPLIDIPPNVGIKSPAWEFDTDLIIAEEMGSALSVDWVDCGIVKPHNCVHGVPLSISVPKTIMPVKLYANPVVQVKTNGVTAFSWGVSYAPATQDVMRIADSLSSSPRDSSPVLGFWDKMRLIFHWSIRVSFTGDVHLHAKGSRDPYNVLGNGAGIVLCFQGHPQVLINQSNDDRELVQVSSDSMVIAIPSLDAIDNPGSSENASTLNGMRRFKKICAKLTSGVRFGVGFALERTCGHECVSCHGPDIHRKCRFFDFRPHYEVRLEKKSTIPQAKGPTDSFNGFRSDFIHMSLSLTSSTHGTGQTASSLHLTPNTFSHFWSWVALFDGALSLPIRQGRYYPQKSPSPKFGRHLATLKYRISLSKVYIMHAYIDDSRESWVDGVTPFVGVKALVEEFQADMHQRDQEISMPGLTPDSVKVVRRKSVYAAEVVLKGLDMRAMLAIFLEPLKRSVPVTSPPRRSNYRTQKGLPTLEPSSTWIDMDDFIETDWSASVKPTIHLLPIVLCPCITYFNRKGNVSVNDIECSKFGAEDTHVCILGKEATVLQVQMNLAEQRISELRNETKNGHDRKAAGHPHKENGQLATGKMIGLLEDYVSVLREADGPSQLADAHNPQSYYMPSDTVSPNEWAEFENVYQVHCPKIFLTTAIRDIMMQYYHCSRARRGLEYHMATRAVKFIRDQTGGTLLPDIHELEEKRHGAVSGAHAAAQALRKILIGNQAPKISADVSDDVSFQPPGLVDPLNGWSDGISLRKSDFCLLLKPQIVLRSEGSVCVVAAVQAKLQSFDILDDSNLDDPVSGKVMSRNYSSLKGLQTFSPSNAVYRGDGCLPLEVLIDFRCETGDFDRLVPQTDATFHYDKFNRLRLRNDVTSVAQTALKSTVMTDNHLQNQTDLVQVHIPRFTVSATDEHFQAISNIVTRLILFSDAAYKTRSDKLETLLFTYDFTDLASAANVIEDLQGRLRAALETEQAIQMKHRPSTDQGKLELLKLKAHIFLLAEELDFLFEAVKLAQDRSDDQADHKSALQLHASSSEISWRMLDDHQDLLAKLAVRDIDYSWLSRQDSSTVNNLAIGNLQAFDGSPSAIWAEILCKHNEPASHPLLKRGLFIIANWTVLPPVGGITIYQEFELNLHPMRLQVDAKVGRRIMEYVWPARRVRNQQSVTGKPDLFLDLEIGSSSSDLPSLSRSSLDSPRVSPGLRIDRDRLAPPLRKLGSSRSFTDLRSAGPGSSNRPLFERTRSSEGRQPFSPLPSSKLPTNTGTVTKAESGKIPTSERGLGDAAEMKTRSSQKTFVLVRISSLHLLLSVVKEQSFECHDARIRTHDLEYRNQTWSFEELVDQFIPSDTSWRGWVRMVFHQPLVPVLPVARELISKTKWFASKTPQISATPQKSQPVAAKGNDGPSTLPSKKRSRTHSPHRRRPKVTMRPSTPPGGFTIPVLAMEPETDDPEHGDAEDDPSRTSRPRGRSRILGLFSRVSSRSRKRSEYDGSTRSGRTHDAEIGGGSKAKTPITS